MKIHLNRIPPEGLHVEGEEERDILGLEDETIRAVAPLRYSLDVGLSGSGLFATGSLETELEFQCVRCLERFRYPVQLDTFAVQIELDRSETVDLTPYAREDILLDLPPHPRCDWDGRQRCPGAVPEQGAAATDTVAAEEAWGELNKLKLRTGK